MSLRDYGLSEKSARHLSEALGEVLSNIISFKKILVRETRNWQDFFAVFKVPPSGGIRQRCLTNLNHYWANYFIIALIIFLVRIIFAPFLLFSFIIIAAFLVYFLVFVGDIQISPDIVLAGWTKNVTCAAICVVVLVITRGLEHILWNLIFITALCGMHMVFRPRSVTAATDSSNELKLHGLNWFNRAGASSVADAEDPPTANEEELFLNAYPNASMRKRH